MQIALSSWSINTVSFSTPLVCMCVDVFVYVCFSWLAFEGQDFAGRMYVLEVGSYSDLRAMGCVNASSSILSLQPVGFVSLFWEIWTLSLFSPK